MLGAREIFMGSYKIVSEQRLVAPAKDCAVLFRTSGNPKRFNPLDLLENASLSCLVRIAENASMPPTILEQLALHVDPEVRQAIADNSSTPIDTLWSLAGDPSVDVRYSMSENHHLPIAILVALASDDNPYVACRARATLQRMEGAQVLSHGFEGRKRKNVIAKTG